MTLKTLPLDIATFLKDSGYGVLGKTSSGVEISVAGYYEATTNAIFLTLSGAANYNDVVSPEDGEDTKKNLQILIRNTDQQTCLDTWESLNKLFKATFNTTIGSTKITGFEESFPSGLLKKMNSDYWIYVLNFIVYFEE